MTEGQQVVRERVVFLCQQFRDAIVMLAGREGLDFVAERLRHELFLADVLLGNWPQSTENIYPLIWGMEALLTHYKREIETTGRVRP